MFELVVIFFCLMINALLAAYEMAFVSVPRPELRSEARKGNKSARQLVTRREHPERTLSVIQIGITMMGAVAAAIGGAGAADNLEPWLIENLGISVLAAEVLSILLVVAPITYLSVVVGELVPKTLALRMPLRISLAGAPILFVADRVLSPIIAVLEWSTRRILKLFTRHSAAQETSAPTTIELDMFSQVHQKLMLNLVGIEKKQVKEILLPWSQVDFVTKTDTIEDVTHVVLSVGHTRLPVLENDQVIGILHTKEFVAFRESGERNWLSIIRPILRVHSGDSVLGVLGLLQEKRNHMAIVFSAAGERMGIVTLEDILEEVVGDISDEDEDGRVRKVFALRARSRPFTET